MENDKLNNIQGDIISFVKAKEPVHIGEIFKNLKISQTKGFMYVMDLINNGQLNYVSHNQVHS